MRMQILFRNNLTGIADSFAVRRDWSKPVSCKDPPFKRNISVESQKSIKSVKIDQDALLEKEKELIALEWKYIAICCDTLCMIMFFVIIMISSVWFFMYAYKTDDLVDLLEGQARSGTSSGH